MMPKGFVATTPWLKSHGYPSDLIKRYRRSDWLESLGVGANIRAGDTINCIGGLHALEHQLGLDSHIAGRSAFRFLGKAHYLELAPQAIIIMSTNQTRLPSWFQKHDWGITIRHYRSDFLPPKLGVLNQECQGLEVSVSSEPRALLECLWLTPYAQEASECLELMEFMNNAHPSDIQKLLTHCRSIKVKRLFLSLAEHVGHAWFKYLDLASINLGSGKRQTFPQGAFDPHYQITIPKSWTNHHQ